MSDIAYWAPPDENVNFQSRAPDPGFGSLMRTVGWESLYHSPFYATKRWSELSIANSPVSESRWLAPDEANDKYGMGGLLKFDEPIKEEAAQLMYRRKVDETDRSYLISSGQTTGMRRASSFAVGVAATLLDPINVAAMFIPVAGEARIARAAQMFGGSALKQRLIQGALTGASGAAMVEPFILLPALQEQANYSLKDSALNLGFGAALGGLLHAGIGAVADRLSRIKPRDADAIFESAMNNVLRDEPVTAPAKVAEFVDQLHPKVAAEIKQVDSDFKLSNAVPSQDERIAAAAIRYGDKVAIGRNHPLIIDHLESDLGINLGENWSDGFITSTGRFVNRFEAAQIAEHSGQADPELNDPIKQVGLQTDTMLQRDPSNLWGEGNPQYSPLAKSEVVPKPPTLEDIPRRDSNGRFLSQEKRLALLDEKLRAEKQVNEAPKPIQSTPEKSPGMPEGHGGMTGEVPKDVETLQKDIADIQRALDLKPEEVARLNEDIKAEIGDQPGRAAGIVEGLKCIIRNLI